MTAPNWSSPGTSDATCYLERSKVREILIGHNAATQAVLPKIDALPIFTAEDMRASAMTAPMTSREALQDALDEWARANLPTESAGCITSWSDWIAAFVCDGVFGDNQMHPLSDIRDLDEVVRELGIQDSSTMPAEAVRELNAEIERLRSVAQTGQQPVAWRWKYKDQEAWQHCSAKYTPPHEAISEPLYTPVSSTMRGCGDPACGDPNCTYGQGGHASSTELASPENKDDLLKKPMCIFCGKRVFGPCESKAMAAGCELPPVTSKQGNTP